jgi:hypothetical protein
MIVKLLESDFERPIDVSVQQLQKHDGPTSDFQQDQNSH